MNRLMLSALLAAATVCGWPGVSSADPWADIGPAGSAFNYGGYIDPWTGRSGNGAFSGGVYFGNRPGSGPSWSYSPTWTNPLSPPIYYSHSRPFVASSTYSTPLKAEGSTASIQVRVPANAEIWFDNQKMSQTGSLRDFVSPPLETGKQFTYNLRVRWTDSSGKVIDQTKQVEVQAGQQSTADFMSEVAKSKP
jgi:uncharacterized protein (TIGR03000 family)